ncbi:MAG: hypothetical protein HKN68_19425, partial [Saprospiraceae bacterium]|nr:hypothetical protein [Saprospiraceae bacterium]
MRNFDYRFSGVFTSAMCISFCLFSLLTLKAEATDRTVPFKFLEEVTDNGPIGDPPLLLRVVNTTNRTFNTSEINNGFNSKLLFAAPDIEAWHNLPMASWSGGTTVQQSNSKYAEGDALPFQYTHGTGNPEPRLYAGETHCIILRYDSYADPQSDGHFIDYLESYNATESGVTPFDDFAVCSATDVCDFTVAIPLDPSLPTGLQDPGFFYLYNIVPGSIVFGEDAGDVLGAGETAAWPYVIEAASGGKTTKRLRICFEVAGTGGEEQDVGIAWGGHLAEETFWGEGKGAGNFPGASPQFRINFDDATSDENININPNAILPLPRIDFITKDAQPDDPQDFNFTSTFGDFTLDDDGDINNTWSNTTTFLGLDDNEPYQVDEVSTSGWDLTSITCTATTIQGGNSLTISTVPGGALPNVIYSSTGVTITADLDQQVGCTFVNEESTCIPPTIDTQPLPQTVCEGDDATFTVEASSNMSGGTIEYQWQVDINDGNGFADITNGGNYSGFTTATLTISNTPLSFNGNQYQVIVTETSVTPNCSTTSSSVVLTVNTCQLSIDKAFTSNADNDGSGDVSEGDVLTYTITATNTGTGNLTNVVVSDSKITPSSTTCATLAANATCVLVGTYTVTAADVTAGQVDNTATADSDQTDTVTDTETVPVKSQELSIDKAFTSNADNDGSGDV